MSKIDVDKELCKGCGYCVHFCPRKIVGMKKETNAKGYSFAYQIEENKCTGCKICAIICPDAAIEVYK
ncbi:MAG: 4Fe-4S binding protein [Negativicutes bacterium]|nr:4Fe-4S binding protein [Negativicutes bacterium]